MATKRWKEIKNFSKDEIVTKIRETEAELFQLKMKLKTGQLAETANIWKSRKDLARMKTLQTQSLAGAAPAAVVAKAATAKAAKKTTAKATGSKV